MKVGIVTIHFVPNYGAMLQAFALASYLRRSGVDATIIDYRQPELEAGFRLRWRMPPPLRHWLRLKRCRSFVASRLPLSPRQYRSADEFAGDAVRYDALIAGSDQVWFTGPVQNYDRMYFLDFPTPGCRKLSYAASVGGTTSFGPYESQARTALRAFKHLSVRDAHTAALVRSLVGREPAIVVDPVFLSDFAELPDCASRTPEPYLLVFGNFTGALAPVISFVAAATGLRRIVSLQYPCAAADQRIASPGPADWLSWFRHAAFIVTSYFHGTAFAVKFEKPFLAIPTPGRRLKVASMLDELGLRTRLPADEPSPETCAARAREPIAWPAVRRLLDEQIQRSTAFLQTSLG